MAYAKLHNESQGFWLHTLIEVMITVVIWCYFGQHCCPPSYLSSVRDSRRADAKQAILTAAQTMESFYAMNMTYGDMLTLNTPTIFTTKVPKDGSGLRTP